MPLVKQGSLPGTMDVDLKVEDSSPWRGSIGLNPAYDTRLTAEQGGARKGQLRCELRDNGRVIISGQAALYLRGTIFL